MRPTRLLLTTLGLLTLTTSSRSEARPTLEPTGTTVSVDHALEAAIGPDAQLLQHDPPSSIDGLGFEAWKYAQPDGPAVDLMVLDTRTSPYSIEELLDQRSGQDPPARLTIAGHPASIESTADQYGPGLLILKWSPDPAHVLVLTAADQIGKDELIRLATQIEAAS